MDASTDDGAADARMAQDLVAEVGLPRNFPKRFMEVYASLSGSWESAAQLEAGWRAGVDSAEFLRAQNAPFDVVGTKPEAVYSRDDGFRCRLRFQRDQRSCAPAYSGQLDGRWKWKP